MIEFIAKYDRPVMLSDAIMCSSVGCCAGLCFGLIITCLMW